MPSNKITLFKNQIKIFRLIKKIKILSINDIEYINFLLKIRKILMSNAYYWYLIFKYIYQRFIFIITLFFNIYTKTYLN